MNRTSSSVSPRWAVVLLAVSVLALAGCGRKGPLDLPPTGSQSNLAPTADTETQQGATPSVFNSTYGADAPPAAPKGNQKSFILDPLLNSN